MMEYTQPKLFSTRDGIVASSSLSLHDKKSYDEAIGNQVCNWGNQPSINEEMRQELRGGECVEKLVSTKAASFLEGSEAISSRPRKNKKKFRYQFFFFCIL